ncbi:DUF2255 family protein [Gordonia sp. CPCC 205515]|uniref:DUF2255 family protein n=1 Tax=Gordonia sp. CPCC 205515 TaxID=3140791 RepID=UPI003AF3B1AB
MTSWTVEMVAALNQSDELEIAARRSDGTLTRFVPIWVVCVDDDVYVRTWHRRETGWYGRAVQTREAQVRLGSNNIDVAVSTDTDDALRPRVDAAYREKYSRYGTGTVDRMVNDSAAQTTLRLTPGKRVTTL